MKAKDYLIVGLLSVLAAFIWLRDTSWASSSDDTLPILVALPLFVWMGWPWQFRDDPQPLRMGYLLMGVVLFLAGIIANLTILLGIAWTLLLWAWLCTKFQPESLTIAKKLLILPLMAFPWVALDAEPLGWWFRLSGAWATAKVLGIAGVTVAHEGTKLLINGLPISVEAACSGMKTLQSMLIAGSLVAFIVLGDQKRYWWNLPLLIVMAWLANTVRILGICVAAIVVDREFAMGSFHEIGGWTILFVMFCLCWFVFTLQQTSTKDKKIDPEPPL